MGSLQTSRQDCDDALERLTKLHPKCIDLSLGRVERLLRRVGHPERALPPVVHVAGTNGKGSVIAYMRAMLEAAGLRVHVHTSPHLVRFNERIRLSGELISDRALLEILEECETANGDAPITFFEVTTVAALLAFARTPADVVLLETGLGGRLDATNVIDQPALTVITPISLDHQQFLGETLAEIAAEKAGIMKPGVPCVIGHQPAAAVAVLEARAAELGVPLIRAGHEWSAEMTADAVAYTSPDGPRQLPKPALAGDHQAGNAGQAYACVTALREAGFEVPEAAVDAGVRQAQWPARLQRLTTGPLVSALPEGWELWLDGGHNGAAGEMIAAHVRSSWADRPLYLVCGMLNSKEPRDFLAPLAGLTETVLTVAIPGEPNALSAAALAQAAIDAGHAAQGRPDVTLCVGDIVVNGRLGPKARILICGSLYLAGKVLAENGA